MRKLMVILMCVTVVGSLPAKAADGDKKSVAEALYKVISEKGVEGAVEAYHNLKVKASGEYDFSEAELNKLGYRLMNAKNTKAAIAILRLNVESFPHSPNAYDSLAEAYMRAGQNEQAVENYEKVLVMLKESDLDKKARDFLHRNASGRLQQLRNPQATHESQVIDAFLGTAAAPFGKIHPAAPPETEQWGQLAGIWACENEAYNNGQWFSGWPATWVWKYTLDGFAVQDLWLQKQENLPPPLAGLGHDLAGTNIRIYDPALKKWQVAWFANSRNTMSQFEAEYRNGEIIMTPAKQSGPKLRRVVFHNIAQDSFDWKSEVSEDDGKTWQATFKIRAKRLR